MHLCCFSDGPDVLNIGDCMTMRSLLSCPDPTFLAEATADVAVSTESYHSDAEDSDTSDVIQPFTTHNNSREMDEKWEIKIRIISNRVVRLMQHLAFTMKYYPTVMK